MVSPLAEPDAVKQFATAFFGFRGVHARHSRRKADIFERVATEASKLAEGLSLKQNASSVVASFSLPADDLVNLMKADAAKKAEKEKEKEKE